MAEALLYTPEEAAQMLGVGRSRVFDLMSSGALPSVRIGRSRRITRDALLAFVAQLEQVAETTR